MGPYSCAGLGAVSRRSLGVGAGMGLDMGFVRTLGMGSVSLRSLVRLQQFMGMVARSGVRLSAVPAGMGARLRILLWFRRRGWRWSWFWIRFGRLVADWT